MPQKMAIEFVFWAITFDNPSINVKPGSKCVWFDGIVKIHPSGRFCFYEGEIILNRQTTFLKYTIM